MEKERANSERTAELSLHLLITITSSSPSSPACPPGPPSLPPPPRCPPPSLFLSSLSDLGLHASFLIHIYVHSSPRRFGRRRKVGRKRGTKRGSRDQSSSGDQVRQQRLKVQRYGRSPYKMRQKSCEGWKERRTRDAESPAG